MTAFFARRRTKQPRAGRPGARGRACILRQHGWDEPTVQRDAEALVGAGFNVDVICMRDPGRPRRAVVNGVTRTSLSVSRRKSSKARYAFDYGRFFVLAAWILTVRHLRRPYAVVQVNSMPDFLVFAALVPKLMGSRVVAYMGEPTPELAETLFGPGWLTAVLARIEQSALRFADHSVTPTDQLKQRYVERGAAADRITVVLNHGYSMDAETAANRSPRQSESKPEFVVVCHGTIEDRYGQDTIIEAAHLLREEMPDLRVIITGRGSQSDKLISDIARRGLQEVVRFEGWVSRARLNEVLHSADIGVVAQKASRYSHLVHTNKMIDYWIFGLPVIATRLRAVSELYDDDVIEYFEPGDAASLAAAIKRLRAAPSRRAQLAQNGKLAQLRNGWETQRAVYLGIFDAILKDEKTLTPELNL
jgi:glycosyltransferase involved in cell wall biosynthesis